MSYVSEQLEKLKAKNANEPEFIQAATEVLTSLEPVFEQNPKYEENGILERITEPERVIMFRVPWVDDNGKVQVNRGSKRYTSFHGSGEQPSLPFPFQGGYYRCCWYRPRPRGRARLNRFQRWSAAAG